MSSNPLRRIYGTFGSRMTVSFSLAFILCSLVLFGLAYILVSSSLETNDRMAIRLKLKEYMDEYRLGALTRVRLRRASRCRRQVMNSRSSAFALTKR